MPYVIAKKGPDDKPFCIYREGADKGPTGDTLGCHATEAEAKKQLAALYANEPAASRARVKTGGNRDGIERRDLLTSDIELREEPDAAGPVVSGYASVFNSLSEVLFEWDTGKFRELVAPGAFRKSLREQNIPLLVEHANLPLATTGARTLELDEDGTGLRFRSVLDATDPDVQRIIPKMRRGDLNKMSFGFIPIRESWDEKSKPRVRTLHEVRLMDVSIVGRPAYPATEAKVRKALADDGLDAENIAELLVRLRQGLDIDEEDRELMRRLGEMCSRHLEATAPEAAPPNGHPADDMQPVTTTSAPDPVIHPLSWYREQIDSIDKRR